MNRSPWMPPHWRLCLRVAAVALIVGLICLLQACGGGDDEEPTSDGTKTTPPLNCTFYPELCR